MQLLNVKDDKQIEEAIQAFAAFMLRYYKSRKT